MFKARSDAVNAVRDNRKMSLYLPEEFFTVVVG
jgi:hypothetical protein